MECISSMMLDHVLIGFDISFINELFLIEKRFHTRNGPLINVYVFPLGTVKYLNCYTLPYILFIGAFF